MSGNKSTTQTASSEPWKAAQPALQSAIGGAQSLYNAGVGGKTFTGSTVVPFAQQTTQGMNQMQAAANGAAPAFQQNFEQVAANARNGGLNELQRGAIDKLQPMASGEMLNGNPYLDEIIRKNSEDISTQVGLMSSGAGRYGSGAHTGVLADSIGDMANTARFNNYNTERGFMQDAIGSIFNAGQQQQNNINSNTAALAGAFEAGLAPGQTLMDIGGNYEDLYGRQLNDQLRIFNDTQNKPWEQLGRLNAIASGAGQMGGTQQTTAQGPSRLSSGLGGALSGFGATNSLWGAGLGGLAGLL